MPGTRTRGNLRKRRVAPRYRSRWLEDAVPGIIGVEVPLAEVLSDLVWLTHPEMPTKDASTCIEPAI